MPTARAAQHAELGLVRRRLGLRVRVVGDAGAYPPAVLSRPPARVLMVPGPYDIANVDIAVRPVATTPPGGRYRGPVSPNPTPSRTFEDLAAP